MAVELTVLHAIGDLHPRSGGIARVVVDATDALARQPGLAVDLLYQATAGEPALDSACAQVQRTAAESASRIALALGLPFRSALQRTIANRRPAVIHNHGLWLPANHWAASAARVHRIPVIAQPHGMLEPWALRHKALKKHVALLAFQRRDLESARLLVATSTAEYENVRKLGFRQPIAIIPNGITIPRSIPATEKLTATSERLRTALFLSRVHPVKGLINLMRAWAQVQAPDWRLQIAGPDEGGHLQDVMSEVNRLGIGGSVSYMGEVDGVRKSAIYRAADLFVLPTYTENFGVVVAEALAHEVPVITTKGAPWADLETHRCGWWVEIGVEPLAVALRAAMALGDEDRHAMGARGRELVMRYEWEGIAGQTREVYRWLVGLGNKPACVSAV